MTRRVIYEPASLAAVAYLRDEIHTARASGAALLQEIPGDDTPANEGWTDTAGGGGTIASAGGLVTWDSMGDEFGNAYSQFTHTEPDGSGLYFRGWLNVVQVEGDDVLTRCLLRLQDGDRRLNLNLHLASASGARITSNANAAIGTVVSAVSLLAAERLVEVWMPGTGTCKVWFDGAADANLTVPYSSLDTTSSKLCQLGGQVNVLADTNCELTGRGIAIWRIN